MSKPPFSCTEILTRLTPLFERVFAAYGVSEQEAQEIVEESCASLMSKKTGWHDPEGWLLRTVVERCRASRKGENR